MHKIAQFLCDLTEYIECKVSEKPIAQMTAKEKDYISECMSLELKTLAVLAGKNAYDTHSQIPSEMHNHNGMSSTHDMNL